MLEEVTIAWKTKVHAGLNYGYVAKDMLVIVRSGERIPVDGMVT